MTAADRPSVTDDARAEAAAQVIWHTETQDLGGYTLRDAQQVAQALADAGLLATARTRPTRDDVARVLFHRVHPDGVWSADGGEAFLRDADAVLALWADQPTEAEAGARALEQAADTLGTRGRMSPQALRDRANDLRAGGA